MHKVCSNSRFMWSAADEDQFADVPTAGPFGGWAGAPVGAPVTPDRAKADDPFGLLATMGISTGWLDAAVPSTAEFGRLCSDSWQPDAPEAAERDGDACTECGASMRRGTNDIEYVCEGCGRVVVGDAAEPDDAPRDAPSVARLRIVGPNSNQLQPDLYRSGAGTTAATQKKQIYEEYCMYRALYIEAGGRALTLDACKLASEYYNEVQVQCVKRSQNKKAIMAACFHHACLEIGFALERSEIAAFMQLPSKGIARGSNFVRSLVADGKMEVNVDIDPCRPEIVTLFARLGLEGKAYDGLRDAVFDVVQTAIANNIGTSSILRSKVAGAAYAVLRRCRDRHLVPKDVSLQEFCADHIRKNTVDRFTRHLDSYHSYFEPCYERAGLDSAQLPARS